MEGACIQNLVLKSFRIVAIPCTGECATMLTAAVCIFHHEVKVPKHHSQNSIGWFKCTSDSFERRDAVMRVVRIQIAAYNIKRALDSS